MLKKPKLKHIIFLFVISILLFITMSSNAFGLLENTGFNSNMMLDKKIFYTSQDMSNLISSLSNEMIKTYFSLHLIDYIFIIFFYPFLRLLLIYVGRRKSKFIIIPLFAMVFDIIENIIIDISLSHVLPNILMTISGVITLFKFICIFVSIILIIYYSITIKKNIK